MALQYQMLFAVVLLSLVVVTGYAGQVSLAQMGMAGIGALISAWLYSSHHLPFLLAALLGIVAVVPVAAVIAVAGVRTRGAALAIVTLGLAFSLEAVLFTNQNYTGGVNGYNTDNPTIFGLAVGGLEYPKRFATLTLIVLVGLGLMVANLRRGRAGRRLIAVRTNERAAAAMGISVSGAKTYAFVLAGMIAAVGGVLFAFYLPAPDFTNFLALGSISLTETAVLGGVGHLGGALIASSYQPNALLTQIFSFLGGNVAAYLIDPRGSAAAGVPADLSERHVGHDRATERPVAGCPPPSGADQAPTDCRHLLPLCRTDRGAQEFAPGGRVRAVRRDTCLGSLVLGSGPRSGIRPDRSERGRKVHDHRCHHRFREDEYRQHLSRQREHRRLDPRAPGPGRARPIVSVARAVRRPFG